MDVARKGVGPCIQTLAVRGSNLALAAHHPRLVAALAVACVHPGSAAVSVAHLVEARLGFSIDELARVEDMLVAANGGKKARGGEAEQAWRGMWEEKENPFRLSGSRMPRTLG